MTYMDALARNIRSNVPPEVGVPEDSGALFWLYALLARVKGSEVSNSDVHDAWTLWMRMRGEDHPSMVPFEDLSPDVQAEDAPFRRAILAALALGH